MTNSSRGLKLIQTKPHTQKTPTQGELHSNFKLKKAFRELCLRGPLSM